MKKLMLSTLIILGSSMSFASETSLWKGQINNDEFESKQVLKIEDDGNGIQHLSWQEHRYKNNTLSKIHFDTIFNEDHYEGEYLNKISFALSTGSEQVCYVKYKIEYRMVGDVLAVSLPRLDSYNFYSNRIPKDFCKVMNIPKEAPQRIIYMSRIGKGLSDEALAKLYREENKSILLTEYRALYGENSYREMEIIGKVKISYDSTDTVFGISLNNTKTVQQTVLETKDGYLIKFFDVADSEDLLAGNSNEDSPSKHVLYLHKKEIKNNKVYLGDLVASFNIYQSEKWFTDNFRNPTPQHPLKIIFGKNLTDKYDFNTVNVSH